MEDDAPMGGDPAATGEVTPAPAAPQDNGTAAQLRIERKARKEYQDRVEALEAKIGEAEKAKLDAQQRAELERDEWKAKFEKSDEASRTFRIRSAYEMEAQKMGAVSTDAAFKLADLSAIELTEDGTVKGISAALKAQKTSMAFLFGGTQAPAGDGGGNPPSGAPKTTASDVLGMSSSEDYQKFRARVLSGEINPI